MKKRLTLQILLLLTILYCPAAYSQAGFTAGKINITVNEFGNIQLNVPSDRKPLNIYRTSVLAGVSAAQVFDYFNDSENEDTVKLDTLNEFSDYRIYGAFNNDDSNLPPEILIKLEVYGWKNASYVLLKFNIQNKESGPINVIAGLEIIPQIGGTPESDTTIFSAGQGVIDIFQENHVGYKLLSDQLASLKTFEYFDGFENDSSFYTWLTYGMIDQFFTSNDTISDNGAVLITSQSPVFLNTNDSLIVYYALAFGDSLEEMFSNIEKAESEYLVITSVNKNHITTENFILHQNYPNPFNPSTVIAFQLPEGEHYTVLKIFDILGREISTIAEDYLTGGRYRFTWNASGLSSGVYLYKLTAGSYNAIRKMILIR